MESGSEITQIAKIQHEIQTLLKKENNVTCHFINENNKIHLLTYNPSHGETFLLHTETINDHENFIVHNAWWPVLNTYSKILRFVKELVGVIKMPDDFRHNANTYTVIWVNKEGESTKSYFSGNNIYEVLDKFYYGKNRLSYNILEIKLNPLA
jgi:hypothetical protein